MNLHAILAPALFLVLAGTVHAQSVLSVNGKSLRVVVAATAEERATGLMHRRQLPADAGMLFVFPESKNWCMWMRNTYIPLSVAFLSEEGVIVRLADMKPLDETHHCSLGDAAYALEVNAGWFARQGARPGTRVRWVSGGAFRASPRLHPDPDLAVRKADLQQVAGCDAGGLPHPAPLGILDQTRIRSEGWSRY